jgi:RNA polymerase sigma factor (sigma-70 family)
MLFESFESTASSRVRHSWVRTAMTSSIASSPAKDPDLELLRRWQAGDQQAGNRLIMGHFSTIGTFFRNKALDHSEDLTQKTFGQLCLNRDTFRGDSSFRTWLFRIAHNILIDHIRRQRRREHIDLDLDSLRDLGATPSSIVGRSRQITRLARALREIPVREQIALEMNYWQGCSHAEIAEALNVPVGTIKTRIFQGKARLRAILGARRDSSHSLDDAQIEQWLADLRHQVEKT